MGKYNIEVLLAPREISKMYEAVVIGSGFGGTVLSLRLANRFDAENKKKPNGVAAKKCLHP
ncbi:MAG TPA: hypothetical protein VF172_13425 [Nitrososphaera sp.]|jgi:hypothetical protein